MFHVEQKKTRRHEEREPPEFEKAHFYYVGGGKSKQLNSPYSPLKSRGTVLWWRCL
jgi:hypothetical protein